MLDISNQKGTLDFNTDADFILLDEQLDVMATYIAGQKVWSKSGISTRKTSLFEDL